MSVMASTIKCINCNIVIDEMLSYIQNKISVIDEESLIKICISTFTSVQIEKSKLLLLESLPLDERRSARKGQGKGNRMLSDIISVFKVSEPELMPIFVARDLNKLPPITFDHLDVSKLLKDIALVQAELMEIKATYVTESQFEDYKKNVKNVKAPSPCYVNMRKRTRQNRSKDSEISSPSNNSVTSPAETLNQIICDIHQNNSLAEGNHCNSVAENKNPLTSSTSYKGAARSAGDPTYESLQLIDNRLSNTMAEPRQRRGKQSFAEAARSQSRIDKEDVNDSNSEWTTVRKRKNRFRERFMGKMGQSVIDTDEKFRAADRKTPIFITNVNKCTVEADIVKYIEKKTTISIQLEKINLKNPSEYNAYKFFVPVHQQHIFLDNSIWPQGVIFRRFIHFRQKSKNAPSDGNKYGTALDAVRVGNKNLTNG